MSPSEATGARSREAIKVRSSRPPLRPPTPRLRGTSPVRSPSCPSGGPVVVSRSVCLPSDLVVCPERGPRGLRVLREAAPYLSLGMEMAVTLLVALGAGYWVDGKLGTRPTFLLVGGTAGIALALYHFMKTVAGMK